jgi:hypothetical protein
MKDIPIDIYNYLIKTKWKIIYQPNIGWDWGCHSQYMQWHLDQRLPSPDYLFFLHDDIIILKHGFIQEFLNKANRGFELIGNSLPFTVINAFEQDYADEAFILQNNGFKFESGKIEIVRGSAFFITYNLAFKALSKLPYQRCGCINLANRSLRMFGSVATHIVGNNKIGYLSEEHFKSNYISEEMRGGGVSLFFFIRRFFLSKMSKFLSIVNTISLKYIWRNNYSNNINFGLKINITKNEFKFGHLNLSIEDNLCSDISFDDLNILFSQNKIQQVITSFEIANDCNLFNKLILNKISKNNIPVDIFIEAENIRKIEFKKFITKYKNLNIKFQLFFQRKGPKLVKRFYIKYPKEYFLL